MTTRVLLNVVQDIVIDACDYHCRQSGATMNVLLVQLVRYFSVFADFMILIDQAERYSFVIYRVDACVVHHKRMET